MIERIISRGLDAPAKFEPTLKVRKGMHGTEEASNCGKVKVCIIHGLNISQKNSYTYCKNLEGIKNQVLRAMLLGGYIGRKRPSLVLDRHS